MLLIQFVVDTFGILFLESRNSNEKQVVNYYPGNKEQLLRLFDIFPIYNVV